MEANLYKLFTIMRGSNKTIHLKCGVKATTWNKEKNLEVSLYDWYAYRQSLHLLGELCNELHEMGYESVGINRVEGYYNSTDDLILECVKR